MRFTSAFALVLVATISMLVAADPPDACSLLDRDDLAAVQGEPYTQAKLTSNGNVSRCFYQLPTFTASVSLDVVNDEEGALWETYLEEDSSDEADRRREEEGGETEKDEVRPIPVSGVGEKAFWLGNAAGATLWVREGSLVLRVSVGGRGTQTEKIERSKRLAVKALKRIAETGGRRSDEKEDPDRPKDEG